MGLLNVSTKTLVISMFGGIVIMSSCKHDPFYTPETVTTPTTPPTSTGTNLDGVALYNSDCAGCHGPIASSSKLGATVSQIQTGINAVTGMNSYSTLTLAQVQAIADALKTTSTSPTPSTDGVTLYATYCAGCHGTLANSAKLGASASLIQTGIATVSDMNSLSTLTATQIQAISDALASIPIPTDGPTLYVINCSGCHGSLANSQVGRASVSEIQQAIKEKSKMKYLSTLSLTQIQAIAGSLANVKGGGG